MKLEMRISRINNRLSLINERCDNFISRENLGRVIQLEYEPCHKIYHFGASLKDLGKKWFAVSRFDDQVINFLKKIKDTTS